MVVSRVLNCIPGVILFFVYICVIHGLNTAPIHFLYRIRVGFDGFALLGT
jgi:hypothetical protein